MTTKHISRKAKVIDLFCGAGGVTTGITNSGLAEVIACINHDPKAIRSHAENHPACKHYTEDIRLFDYNLLPKCDIIWMSAECTHFSIAKGGESRNADSRTLSEEIYRYAAHCQPNYIIVENVKEFLTWGPLVQKRDRQGNLVYKSNGEPYMIPNVDEAKQGLDYKNWVATLKAMGYVNYRYKLLNSADFGAHTSRLRYFGIFSKQGCPIRFPSPTHHKKAVGHLAAWQPVRPLLDFSDLGNSIFTRRKPLSDKTLKRVFAGLQKFSSLPFLDKYYGTSTPINVERPCDTITTKDRFSLVQPFLSKYYSGDDANKNISTNGPAGTITTQDHHSIVIPFLTHQYNGSFQNSSIDSSCPTITTNPKANLVQPFLLRDDFNNSAASIEMPHPTIVAADKNTHIVRVVLGDRLDEKPNDSQTMRELKAWCRANFISDVYMRMLRVDELLQIQGFPPGYNLIGTRKDKKKFIGNSVVPLMAELIIKALLS